MCIFLYFELSVMSTYCNSYIFHIDGFTTNLTEEQDEDKLGFKAYSDKLNIIHNSVSRQFPGKLHTVQTLSTIQTLSRHSFWWLECLRIKSEFVWPLPAVKKTDTFCSIIAGSVKSSVTGPQSPTRSSLTRHLT